jgi:response regulator RpfG family c-di-GMP phosphodiesterase
VAIGLPLAAAARAETPIQQAMTPICPTNKEMQANHVRVLQTELMVAALQCRSHEQLQLDAKYNRFVHQFKGALSQHSSALKEHFRRAYGGEHQRRLDTYVTQLANQLSRRGVNDAEFCAKAAPLFDQVLSVKPSELGTFSDTLPRVQTTTAPSC